MWFTITLVVILFIICLGAAAYETWMERKVAAFMQDRIGPNRAGKFGLLQPLCDGGKLFFKEDFIPRNAEKWLFIIAPGVLMLIALSTGAVIPWGKSLLIGGVSYPVQVASIDVGILYIMGIVSVGVYGIMLGGWASNNKYSLLGAIRASSQMISYELAMGLSLLSIIMMSGTLDLRIIVEQQATSLYGMGWNVLYQPLAFILFVTCSFAELNRAPFDLAECESELVGGYHTEYGSMKFGTFLFAEYINMFINSALISVLFFGGYSFPFMNELAQKGILGENAIGILSIIAFLIKITVCIFCFMWVRWTLPRFRYDQLMHLGWRVMIPLAVLNLLITASVVVFK
ncbi:MAG: NADH-quinone oxidoreductase subunit NuoH [Flavobacteriaceae bacterium]|jgi:NADH-quinone oxidoreductase subunit H|nr:NADH-quinone oxidoreductase subunit NuoH [Flavobacteriaceae bacterium]